jgi:glucose-6-phosphate isomerase
MLYQQITQNCFLPKIGAAGISEQALHKHQTELIPAIEWLESIKGTGQLPLLDLPFETADFGEIRAVADRIRAFGHCVVLGTGGSSLGGQLLVSAFKPPFATPKTTLHFVDNVDPETLHAMVTQLPLADTFFLIISKSGGTAETLMQTLLVLDALTTPEARAKQIAAITIPEANPLRRIAEKNGIPLLAHDPHVGGRFSALSLVGLIPAAVAGIDIAAIRNGAASVVRDLYENKEKSAAALGAALQYSVMATGKNINVMMPYSDRLRQLGSWYCQIWDESLGKQGKGTTAVAAVGSVDQHSQLQLYLEGPKDKLITFVFLGHQGKGPVIHDIQGEASLEYMQGKPAGELIAAQQDATAQTLIKKGVPVRMFQIDGVREETLGALMMHLMVETILVADLMGINAFDQPAVEEGKILAREYLQKRA